MKKILSYFAGVGALVAPFVAMAQGSLPPYEPITTIGSVDALLRTVEKIANWLGTFLMALAVFMILVSAFQFLTAGGNEDKIKSGRNFLIFALVGVAVALVAFALPVIVRPLIES